MAQIKLSIEDIKNQQIRMSSLAERLNAQTERYNNALKRLKDATEGRYSLNMAAKATVTLKMMRELTDNIRMGAQVAQTCIDRFQATDTDLANKTNPANPENVMKETIPAAAYGGALLNPEITNSVINEGGLVKQYQASSANYNGHDYSNYKVVGAYDQGYILNQLDKRWIDKLGHEGCAVTSQAMIHNMAHPESPVIPTDCGVNGGPSCKYIYAHEMSGSLGASASVKRDLIYETVNSGKPTMLWLKGSPNDHAVVAIGVKDGATKGNITNNDILIIDPADAKVKTVAEAIGNGARYKDILQNSRLWVAND